MSDTPAEPSQVVIVTKDDEDKFESAFEKLDSQDGCIYTWENINVFTEKPPSGWKEEPAKIKPDVAAQKSNRGYFKTGGRLNHILKNVSGVVRPGELLALVGASGAGKTSLLNVLHFNSGKLYVEGDRCINGTPVGSSHISAVSAYVQQDDMFIPTLTVREHLVFTARIRMDKKLSFKERLLRVDNAIQDNRAFQGNKSYTFSMNEILGAGIYSKSKSNNATFIFKGSLGLTKCQHSRIGDPAFEKGISGGEMKRLAFAAEFLTDPKILFCDEPTSGLDAFMAQSVVEVMRKMTRIGKSIICTIHQPASEVFELFDHIYLLSQGRVAYSGTIPEALDFFADVGYPSPLNYNPADFFIFTLAIVPGNEEECLARTSAICSAYETSSKYAEIAEIVRYRKPGTKDDPDLRAGSMHIYRAGWWAQFCALSLRSLTSFSREPLLFGARIFQTVAMAIIVGLVFFQQPLNQSGAKNISGCLFILVLNMTIMNSFAVIFTFSSELPIFLREHWNGMYRVDTYFLAKSTSEFPFISMYAVLFNAVCYYMIGLTPGFMNFFYCGVICVMVANVSASFGYFMSTVSKDIVVALAITPPLLVPLFLFSGFFLRDDATPEHFKFAKFASWFYYSCELLFVNQWEDVKEIEKSKGDIYLSDGKQMLAFFGYNGEDWQRDFLCLFGLVVLFRLLAFLCLLGKTLGRK